MNPFRLIASAILATTSATICAPLSETGITIHQLPERRVIIEHAPGIILPDPPEPVVRPAPEPQSDERLAEIAAEWRAGRISHPSIHAGATVYRLPDGSTVTHVTNWTVNNRPPVSFWSSADLSLVAHPAGFAHQSADGEVNYTMLLFWSSYDIAQWQEVMARRGVKYEHPDLPEFPAGPATWIIDESKAEHIADAATEKTIDHLHEHYRQNLTTLRQAYSTLEADRAARRAELEANPPQPRDIHLRVSRLSPAQAAAWHQHALGAKGDDQ